MVNKVIYDAGQLKSEKSVKLTLIPFSTYADYPLIDKQDVRLLIESLIDLVDPIRLSLASLGQSNCATAFFHR